MSEEEDLLWRTTYLAAMQGWLAGGHSWYRDGLDRSSASYVAGMSDIADRVAVALANKAVARWRLYRAEASTLADGPRGLRVREEEP